MTPGVRPVLLLWLACAGSPVASQVAQEAWFPGSSSIAEAEIVPPAYRGTWAVSAAACSHEHGVERLLIFANGVEYYESGGRLERVTQAGQERSVKVKLSYEGEGEFWETVETWTLDEQGERLTIAQEKDASSVFVRCR